MHLDVNLTDLDLIHTIVLRLDSIDWVAAVHHRDLSRAIADRDYRVNLVAVLGRVAVDWKQSNDSIAFAVAEKVVGRLNFRKTFGCV